MRELRAFANTICGPGQSQTLALLLCDDLASYVPQVHPGLPHKGLHGASAFFMKSRQPQVCAMERSAG